MRDEGVTSWLLFIAGVLVGFVMGIWAAVSWNCHL